MATTSEITVGMDAIAQRIYEQRQIILKIKNSATTSSASLAAIPTDFATVIAAIQAYGTSDAYEAAAKAKFTKLVAEYNALKTIADQIAALNLG